MKASIITLICLLLFSCTKTELPKNQTIDLSGKKIIQAKDLALDANGRSQLKAVIRTAHGNIVIKFYPTEAPNTVTRFIELIQKDFYNGLTFHRVIPNFVVQGGDPTASGTGGSGTKLKAEFNKIQHILGTVAMARAQDINSADSQFYIALTTLPHLDEKYTVFGQVVKGLNLLPQITNGDKILSISLRMKKKPKANN